jgi:hypothetical protein
MSVLFLIVLGAFSLSVVLSPEAKADAPPPADYVVTDYGDAGGICSGSAPVQCTTLRSAIDAANADPDTETIAVPSGNYTLSDATTSTDLDVTDDVTLTCFRANVQGFTAFTSFGPSCVVDANQTDRAFDIAGPIDVTMNTTTDTETGDPLTNWEIIRGEAFSDGTNGGGIEVRSAGANLALENVSLGDGDPANGNRTGLTETTGTCPDGGTCTYVAGDGGAIHAAGVLPVVGNYQGAAAALGDAIPTTITLTNVAFYNNSSGGGPGDLACINTANCSTAGGDGGAIYVDASAATVSGDAVFKENSTLGGGISSNVNSGGNGGAIAMSGQASTLDLTDSLFTANTTGDFLGAAADGDGGAIYNSGDDSTFRLTGTDLGFDTKGGGNFARNGGGVYNAGLDVRMFLTNSAIGVPLEGGNAAVDNGGGIQNDGQGFALRLNNSSIDNNGADQGETPVAGGGGINNEGDGWDLHLVNDSSISGNSAIDGGGIRNNGRNVMISVKASSIDGNDGGSIDSICAFRCDGGGILNADGGDNFDLRVFDDSTMSDNKTGVQDVPYPQCPIFICGTDSFGSGGALMNEGHNATVTVTDSTLDNNHAGEHSGAINPGESMDLTITNSTLSDNSAGENGGAIKAANGQQRMTIVDSTFSGNTARGNGGAIEVTGGYGATIEITGSTFKANSSSDDEGGAIAFEGSKLTITDSMIGGADPEDGNFTADSDCCNVSGAGGGIYMDLGDLVVSGTTIQNNVAQATDLDARSYGGGIYTDDDATATIIDSTISDNSADYGGGLSNDGGWMKVVDSTVSNNTAKYDGGGIHHIKLWTKVVNSTISGNQAGVFDSTDGRGGGIFANRQIVVSGSDVTGNSSTNGGGGLRLDGHSVVKDGSLVGSNSTWTNGGGVYGNGEWSLVDSTVDDNSASLDGGGIYQPDSQVTVTRSTLSNNLSGTNPLGDPVIDGQGGGIYASTAHLHNSTVSGNGATLEGGGMWANGTSSLQDVTLAFNAAPADSGGGIFIVDSIVYLKNSIVAKNTGGNCGVATPATKGHNLSDDLISDNTCGLDPAKDDILGLDPLLATLANNGGPTETHALGVGSPAINAGDDAGCPTTDQRGTSRPVGLRCDIGAYEGGTGGPAGPDPFLVNTTADGSDTSAGDGTCAATLSAVYGPPSFPETPAFTPCTLRAALQETNALPGADRVAMAATNVFECSTTSCEASSPTNVYYLPDGELFVSDDVTVDGDGRSTTIIDGRAGPETLSATDRVLNVNMAGISFKLSDLTVRAGNALPSDGGGIFVNAEDVTVRLDNLLVQRNSAEDGGGIALAGADGSLVAKNSAVKNNDAGNDGGGIIAYGDRATVRFTDSRFRRNSASRDGGGIAGEAQAFNLVLESSAMTRQFASDDGGAIYTTGDGSEIELLATRLHRNRAVSNGGALRSQDGRASVHVGPGSEISFNRADSGDGGGISMTNAPSTLTMEDAVVRWNRARNGSGGGLHVNQQTCSESCWNRGTDVVVTDSEFAHNFARRRGGGIFFNANSLSLTGSANRTDMTVHHNRSFAGGGLYIAQNGLKATLTRTSVDHNRAGAGGCEVCGRPGAGGGINRQIHSRDERPTMLTLVDSAVADNHARYGAGIFNLGDLLKLNDSDVTGNDARHDGGGIYDDGPNLAITDTTITGNNAGRPLAETLGHGGGLYASGDKVLLRGADVSDNDATGNGGGARSEAQLSAEQTTFDGNTAGGQGGGLSFGGATRLDSSTISNNAATGGNGGGLYGFDGCCEGGTDLMVTNSTISTNTASSNGGGLYYECCEEVNFRSTTFSGNTAVGESGGAAIYDPTGATTWLKNTIIANSTGKSCLGSNITSLGNNLSDEAVDSCGLDAPGDLLVTNAGLGGLANNGGPTKTHGLFASSPALDAASEDCPHPYRDQRGVNRPSGSACDIGAFEGVISSGGSIGGAVTQCSDGIDNDGDGKIDFTGNGNPANKDPGCESPEDDTEAPDPTPTPSPTPTKSPTPTQSPSPSPTGGKQCHDGIDNDGDGKIDFHDDGSGDDFCVAEIDDEEGSVHPRCGMPGVLCGTNGPDKLKGSNEIYGGPGNDVCIGTPDPDIIFCGQGNDVIRGKKGSDFLRSTSGSDRIVGGGGNDRIRGGGGDDFLRGGKGNDRERGGAGDDAVRGRSGNDRLVGGKGIDLVVGNAGDDYLRGSSGDDTLLGGGGTNVCVGGPGKDKLKGCS